VQFFDVPNSESFTRSNVTAPFDTATGLTTGVVTAGFSLAVNLVSPSSLFEGNTSIIILIGSLLFSHVFQYVRPCNFDKYCPSSGLIPNDLKILQVPPAGDICLDSYCLDPKLLPLPILRSIDPLIGSTVGGTVVTIFTSDLLAISSTYIYVSSKSARSNSPIAASVVSFDPAASMLTFVAPFVLIEYGEISATCVGRSVFVR
jgi:hypothetical protein